MAALKRKPPQLPVPWPISVVLDRLDAMSAKLDQILANEAKIMATLDEVLADVTDEGTRIDSLIVLLNGIKQQLKDALAGVLTPELQAKVDAIFSGVEANKGKVQAAIDAGTT